jgi:hypothetical protein
MCSDFTDKSILVDFYESLDLGLRSQLTESAFYMGKPGLPLKGSGELTRCQGQACKWRDTDASATRRRVSTVDSRELVHTFRQRTLILVKALMLQKRVSLLPPIRAPSPR